MQMTLIQRHKRNIVKFHYLLLPTEGKTDVISVGKSLMEIGFDNQTDGFWVLGIGTEQEFYSPKFREILGYENENDFPNIPESWQSAIDPGDLKRAINAYTEHLKNIDSPYCLDVTYNTKQGGKVRIRCAGSIVRREGESGIMLGTHELL